MKITQILYCVLIFLHQDMPVCDFIPVGDPNCNKAINQAIEDFKEEKYYLYSLGLRDVNILTPIYDKVIYDKYPALHYYRNIPLEENPDCYRKKMSELIDQKFGEAIYDSIEQDVWKIINPEMYKDIYDFPYTYPIRSEDSINHIENDIKQKMQKHILLNESISIFGNMVIDKNGKVLKEYFNILDCWEHSIINTDSISIARCFIFCDDSTKNTIKNILQKAFDKIQWQPGTYRGKVVGVRMKYEISIEYSPFKTRLFLEDATTTDKVYNFLERDTL